MQQAGATPAEAMAFALCSAIQYANDLVARGRDPDSFLPRFSFFFDVSISFFEEIAKFRAGRRIWSRITAERFGARDPRSRKFRFHAQTSGADLTRQQPLNNIARVAIHAMAGIFGGLQSLHTDSFDEAIGIPTETSARIAVATQQILRDEAHLDDVIDPLGGSFYVEAMTDRMEEEIMSIIEAVDAQGGMYEAVQSGFVQERIGRSALEFQRRIESGEQVVVGVNAWRNDDEQVEPPAQPRPDPVKIAGYLERLERYRARRDPQRVSQALGELGRAFEDPAENTYGKVVEAVAAGATHGEICHRVREAVGFGQPLVVV
jgi:methylmalonyl-CoA mutase N-terminal domain/subunit